MMEPADLRQRYDRAPGGRVDGARLRRVLAQGQMRSRPVIVGKVGLQDRVRRAERRVESTLRSRANMVR